MIAIRKLPLLLVLLLAAGCTTTGAHRIQALPAGQQMAVVSVLGDDLSIDYVGTLVFENEGSGADVADWGTDELVETVIKDQLAAAGRFVVAPCEPDRQRFKAAIARPATWLSDNLAGVVAEARRQCDADLYLVAYPFEGELDPGLRASYVRGYGLYRSNFFGLKGTLAYTALTLYLFDRSGDEAVGSTLLREYERVESDRYATPSILDAEAAPGARTAIERLLRQHLVRGLHEMKVL